MKILTLCKPYLLSQKTSLMVYIVISLATAAIAILSPYIIGSFLDNLIEGADRRYIFRFCLIFGGLSLLKIIKNYITSLMYVKMMSDMGYDLNMDAVKHIQNLSLSYINNKDIAYLSQRVGSDSVSLIVFCITVLQSILTNAVMLVVPFVILLNINWFIAVLLMGFLAVYVFLYFAFSKTLYNANFTFREAQNKFFASMFEQLKYIKLIKVNSIQPEMKKRADTGFANMRSAGIYNQKVSYMYSGLDGFISATAQIILFVVGGIQVLEGNFTIGMFTIFTSYFGMMLKSSRYFFGLGDSYQSTMVTHDRIKEILEQKPENCGALIADDINQISLRNVGFSYGDENAVENFNMSFQKNKIYAISGANGAGKSTLISLIIGLYIDEYSGSITYDGNDIRNINMVSARKNLIGLAEQEPRLIMDSIGYNLGNVADISETLNKHIRTLNMQGFIAKTGLDFQINDTVLSGGEKQKIAILKVLNKNPQVMIFDEPTSALDDATTKDFIDYLQSIKNDKIIILITHDEFVKNHCDDVVALQKSIIGGF